MALEQTDPARVRCDGVTSGEFSILSEEYSPWSGIWGDIYPIG